jgi:hypothetical protein
VKAISKDGCYSYSDTLEAIVYPKPAKQEITEISGTLELEKGYDYIWYRDSTQLEATSNILGIDNIGKYYAKIFNRYGCYSFSDTVDIGIEYAQIQDDDTKIVLYPMEIKENINIEIFNSQQKTIGLEVFDLSGKLVSQIENMGSSAYIFRQLNFDYSEGVYFFVFSNGMKQYNIKVVKCK